MSAFEIGEIVVINHEVYVKGKYVCEFIDAKSEAVFCDALEEYGEEMWHEGFGAARRRYGQSNNA